MTIFTVLSTHRLNGKTYIHGAYSSLENAKEMVYFTIEDEPAPDKKEWIAFTILQTTFKDYQLPVTVIVQ